MFTIGLDQLLSNSYLYEHLCLENIKKLYKSAGKCDYQYQYKAILEASMVLTPEEIKYNSPLDVGTPGTLNNPSARNLLSQILEILDVTQKMISADWYLLQKSTRPYNQSVLYGLVFINIGDI